MMTTKEDVDNFVQGAAVEFRGRYEHMQNQLDTLKKEHEDFCKINGEEKINADPGLKEISDSAENLIRNLEEQIIISQETAWDWEEAARDMAAISRGEDLSSTW